MTAFNEAPASANCRISRNGFEWRFTIRADSGQRLMQMMQAFEKHAAAAGFEPVGGTTATASDREAGSFPIESITYDGKTSQGDDSWRVKGGHFTTYGMLMYPEQWQASGLQPPAPGAPVAAHGGTAHHNGKKIVRLELPPAAVPVAASNGTHNDFEF